MTHQDAHINRLLNRWIDGSITAREEAELDRAAQNDPWLAEALAAYRQQPEADHQESLVNLRKRLAQTTSRKTPLTPMIWRVAAALLLLVVAAWWIWQTPLSGPQEKGALATDTAPAAQMNRSQSPSPESSAAEAPAELSAAQQPPEVAKNRRVPSPAAPLREEVKRDAIPPPIGSNEKVATAPVATAKNQPVPSGEAAPSIYPPREVAVASEPTPAAPPTAAGMELEEADEMVAEEDAAPNWEDFPIQRPQTADPAMMSNMGRIEPRPGYYLVDGVVIDKEGYPLIGANILDMGSNRGAISDIDGRFQLVVDTTTRELEVSYTGFGTEVVAVSPSDQEVEVVLDEQGSLSEVVVTGQGLSRRTQAQTAASPTASPVDGERAFRRYIRRNTPAGTPAGEVRLRFMVQADGTLRDISILATPNDQLGQLAKELLLNGPKWTVENGVAPLETTYTVEFK